MSGHSEMILMMVYNRNYKKKFKITTILVIILIKFILFLPSLYDLYNITGRLYFGDNKYGNRPVPMGTGGAGGGRLTLNSRHVDVDGYITVSGLAPDARFNSGAGMC